MKKLIISCILLTLPTIAMGEINNIYRAELVSEHVVLQIICIDKYRYAITWDDRNNADRTTSPNIIQMYHQGIDSRGLVVALPTKCKEQLIKGGDLK